jgi:subtilisin-like proprotein convertase family protein/subtilisin family serine protease
MFLNFTRAGRKVRVVLLALLAAIVPATALAQQPYSPQPPVDAPFAHRGQSNVALGDYYVSGGDRIELYRRADQVVVRLRPQFDSIDAINGLTAPSGPLAGFSVVRDFGNGLRMFANSASSADALPPQRAYSNLRSALSRLASEPNVLFATPVFVNAKLGTYAVATDEVLVRLQPGVKAADFFADPRFAGYEQAPASDAFLARAAAGAGEPALAVAASLQGDDRVIWAEPNFYQERQRFFVPNDTLFGEQWHLQNSGQGGGTPGADAKLVPAWDVATTPGNGVVIAIVDDGPEITHPDLALFTNANEIAGNGIDDDNNGFIDDVSGWDFTSAGLGDNNGGPSTTDDEHGTSVAGVAAARGNNAIGVTGAAYQATIFPARIFLGATPTSDANIGAALAYASGRARAPGGANWRGADIVNNSWGGGGPSAAINDALTWAATNGRGGLGTIHFFATGNSGASSISLPASLSGTIASVIAVGASNNFDVRSSYSQYGPQIDFVAPSNGGSRAIVTTDRLGAPGYNGLADQDYTNGFGGTSSATPLAAGVAGVLLSQDPTLTLAEVRALMRGTADKIGPLAYDANGFNLQYGYGRINADNLVRAVGVARIGVNFGATSLADGSPLVRPGLAGETQTLTFTVRSIGGLELELDSLDLGGDAEFSLDQPLGDDTLSIGESTTFSLRFSSPVAGTFNATVSIDSNDADTPSFDIPIEIQVAPVSIGGSAFEDWNGDGIAQPGDSPISGLRVYLDADADGNFDGPVPTTFNSPANLGLGFGASSTSHTLTAAGLGGELQGLEVRVSLTHTWVGDVQLRLLGPNGTNILLVRSPGGDGNSGDNMTNTVFADDATATFTAGGAPYTGRFLPAEPLSTFNGIDPNGNWTLQVSDIEPTFDNGTLVNWSLTAFTNGERSRLTNAAGDFSFATLPPGSYTARTTPLAGWSPISPAGGSHVVNVIGSESNIDRDFGLARFNGVYGRIYADVDADGSFDNGTDLPVESETVFLDANANATLDPPTPVTLTRTPGLAIPDNNATGSTDTLVSTEAGFLSALTVEINIVHTWVGDLEVRLTSPSGTVIPLITRRGGNGDNFTGTVLDDAAANPISGIANSGAPFTGSFRPEQPLGVLTGQVAAGNWQLTVADRAGGDIGTITSWSLNLQLVEASRVSNEFGNFRFDGVTGSSDLRLVVPPGFSVTQPASGNYPIAMSAGDIEQNRDFGIRDNTAPSFTSSPVLEADEDALYTYAVTTSDPDAVDVPVLSATVLPGWLSFVPDGNGNGTLSGTPEQSDVGDHTVTLAVTDGVAAPVQQSFVITVANTNDAPTVANAIPDQTATEDAAFSFQFAANTFADVDAGDALTYTAQLAAGGALPAWLTFDPGTRTFSGTPGNDDVGTVAVRVIASDTSAETVAADFDIEVEGVNDAPAFTGEPYFFLVLEGAAVDTVVGTLASSDIDGGAPVYSITGGNTGGAFEVDGSSGTITVANPAAVVIANSEFELQVAVDDGAGGVDTSVVTISVQQGAPPGPDIFEDGFEGNP